MQPKTQSRTTISMCFLFLTAASVLAAFPFAGVVKEPEYKPIHVVCTTGMVADLVRNIGGNHVRITQLMKAGVDPHLYKASPGDIRSLSEADIICYSGQHLEGKMADVLKRLSQNRRSVAVTDGIDPKSLLRNDGKGHFLDV